ncbi:sensor domain-containing diguanylate cyclase [Thiocystis violascens]|uniref:diguanylate cyclase n=1 Tax=Thiocystis violascens (strain ATCC 17096 / DSM 198 / 6111) TaxID=765911 RepID=I3Y8H7_THIV6|nr:GGDEF domain-containing protein [Thiocystis violascens]AFL73295.1 diguanylate cyclase (GGDEF) domain-containing protein [Thiocystis violascens DSM 198]
MSTPAPNQWKEKYLSTLDEIETKEKAWEQIETILRQAVSRLALAAETSDTQMKGQLETLRSAIRKNATASQIGKLMEDISSSMVRLDQERGDGSDSIKSQLSRLEGNLDKLRVPDGLKQDTKELRTQLRDALRSNDLKPALDAYSGYVDKLVACLAAPQQDGRDGLFGRFFGRKPAEGIQENPGEPGLAPALALDTRELNVQDASTDAPPAFNQVLFDLLHRLDLPAAVSAQFQSIATLLHEPPSSDLARRVVADIAELMAKARQHVEQEKKEIETFLSQLTGRLQDLDRYLEDAVGYRGQSAQQGDAIDKSMSAEVDGIRKSVDEAENIDQLKASIQARLSSIQLHMDARKRLEQDRLKQADSEIDHLKQALAKVHQESGELRVRLSQERDRALRDALTGLNNRLAYDERITQECERWERYGRPTVLSIWDVDHFKRVNDQFGHSAGDNVLKILGNLLNKHTRKSDFIARFGGEEFMLLLPETDIQTAFEVADKLREFIAAAKFLYRGQPVPVTMSCGLAECVVGDTPESLYRRADTALYEAKQGGRNCCRIGD